MDRVMGTAHHPGWARQVPAAPPGPGHLPVGRRCPRPAEEPPRRVPRPHRLHRLWGPVLSRPAAPRRLHPRWRHRPWEGGHHPAPSQGKVLPAQQAFPAALRHPEVRRQRGAAWWRCPRRWREEARVPPLQVPRHHLLEFIPHPRRLCRGIAATGRWSWAPLKRVMTATKTTTTDAQAAWHSRVTRAPLRAGIVWPPAGTTVW